MKWECQVAQHSVEYMIVIVEATTLAEARRLAVAKAKQNHEDDVQRWCDGHITRTTTREAKPFIE